MMNVNENTLTHFSRIYAMNSNENYCQLCAELRKSDKLLNLLADQAQLEEVSCKLSRINALTDFAKNQLAKVVCLVCLETLDRAYNFVINVERAQITLNELVEKQHHDVTDIDPETNDSLFERKPDLFKLEQLVIESPQELNSKPTKKDSKNKHSNIKQERASVSEQLQTETWSSYNWLCKFCDHKFPSLDDLRTHSMEVHKSCIPFHCDVCSRSNKQTLRKFIIHVKRHHKHLKYSCYICFKKYSKPTLDGSHRKNNHKETEYLCPGCHLCFENEQQLKEHKDNYYNRTYIAKSTLNKEIKRFICPDCNKICPSRCSLLVHSYTHIDDKDRPREYTCEQCGNSFRNKENLKQHITIHSDDRPFKCEVCDATFKIKKQLKVHTQCHYSEKPFKCDQCGRGFRTNCQLKKHGIIHTDVFPYRCEYCDKQFRFSQSLRDHEKIHTGLKPYSCDICHRDFAIWPNYNKHMKTVHGKNMAKRKIKTFTELETSKEMQMDSQQESINSINNSMEDIPKYKLKNQLV